MKFTTLILLTMTLNLGILESMPKPQPSAVLVSIASAPLAVQGLVVLIVLIFGVISLAALWKSKR